MLETVNSAETVLFTLQLIADGVNFINTVRQSKPAGSMPEPSVCLVQTFYDTFLLPMT